MSSHVKNKMAAPDNHQTKQKEERPGFLDRLIHKKGTAEEPWPTAEELWEDEKVKKAIVDHNESLKNKQES